MEIKQNKEILVCKACGYKIKAEKLKDVCPACGVNKKFFEPFKDNISKKRRYLIELKAHPILVHFPVAVSILLFIILLINIFAGGKISLALSQTAVVLSIVLPFFVIGGTVSGIIDGMVRFKKLKRPLLLTKIYLSICFFALSLAIIIIIQLFGFDELYISVLLIILSLSAAISGTMLGKLGGYLVEAILPGK